MISYDLSKRGDLPRYQYLYTRIREDITNGRLRPDERMPSKRRFAEVLNVSVNTVMTAYDLLVAEGLLVDYRVCEVCICRNSGSKKKMATNSHVSTLLMLMGGWNHQ